MKRKRHGRQVSTFSDEPHNPYHLGLLRKLKVNLTSPCSDDEYPSLDMQENYKLTVSPSEFVITTNSIWGVKRGFQTFAQLFYINEESHEVRINETEIDDYPRYPHRGLLLDTSRHFVSVPKIMETLAAMAMNKMNVFHWHIVDDQSFPYESTVFPELSKQGAYHKYMVYSKAQIEDIIEYARKNAIRVIPEFDVPGHTRSWGVAYPDILTKCYDEGKMVGLGPMNPINNSTYKIIEDLFEEVGELFVDKYLHLGGDEVELDCWLNNPEIKEYMTQNNITSVSEMHALFMQRVIPLLGSDKHSIVWEEVFTNKVPLSKDTLIQVWKSDNTLNEVVSAGHLALYSAAWYLDHLSTGGDYDRFYTTDPGSIIANETLAKNVMGGEACMWGEVVDDTNVISRVWPRASAVAERLWSAKADFEGAIPDIVRSRLEEHSCRMIRNGIAAQPPNGPGFCYK